MKKRKLTLVLLLLLYLFDYATAITCADSYCAKCYGTGEGQCFKCNSPRKLQAGKCVSSCDSLYLYDSYDNICKKARYKYEYPCSPGFYNPSSQKGDPADCLSCPSGTYCPGLAYAGSVKPCDAGYYCIGEASMGMNDNPSNQATSKTKICPAGSYCPEASSSPTSCPAGKYCERDRLTEPTGLCKAGYLCTGGSSTPRPTGTGGNICPAGYYCPEGTTDKIPCPVGKYLNSQGGKALEDCLDCPAGKYCGQIAATGPQGECTAGYYCPAGTTTPTPAANYCPAGNKCPTGSPAPIPCDPHEYQLQTNQAACVVCPAGYYCEGGTTKRPCPAGSFCPGNNVLKNCPIGTYGDTEGNSAVGSCKDCPQGLACETPGIVYPIVTCASGYYCSGGTKTRYPTSDASHKGNKCTPGYYCPERSEAKVDCPAGEYCAVERLGTPSGKCQKGYYCPARSSTGMAQICSAGKFCPAGSGTESLCPKGHYGPLQGAASIDDCLPCDMGKFCDSTGMATPNPTPCAEGYYCPLSQFVNPPQSTMCPKGYKCPEGSVAPTPCPAGTYQPNTQQADCLPCPEGYYCDGVDSSQKLECPRGCYCPQGTAVPNEHPCPAGKYYDKVGAKENAQCKDCPAGFYCPNKGQSTYSDMCV